ncbi:MAG: glutamate formimidoyltransferase [candidate division KSB1 bacterium]|nr:glutamate formimidoyltransferase [candidate division KSB1 bacterium]
MKLVECVPNFSEGRDAKKIQTIHDAITSVSGVKVLHRDSGFDVNRTVITFAGDKMSVFQAAFNAIQTAFELIDMRSHKGVHPRVGATDVCPFIPLSGTSMRDCISLARELGKKVGAELDIPVYLYAHAALIDARRNLSCIRSGEYEGFQTKLEKAEWKPDFGPARFNPVSGATAIGARPLLIAYNINLDTEELDIAKEIAAVVRESGKRLVDPDGSVKNIPGRLKQCKAIGWTLKQYNKVQVSMNLVDFTVTPMHTAFETVKEEAKKRSVHVTGSELIGMCPLEALLQAGRYYLQSDSKPDQLIQTAVQALGLNDLGPFDPDAKIIERQITKLFDEP